MSKLKIDIDKKQMPQVVGLGVLSLGLVGYLSMRMLAPSSPAGVASAASATASGSVVHAAVSAAGVPPPDASSADLTDGAAPMPGMRDPFIPLVTDTSVADTAVKPVKLASALTAPGSLTAVPGLPPSAGSVQPLPGFGSAGKPGALMPLAAPIAAPTWTVTGVLSGEDPAAGRIAVLRQGDVRRFVRVGAMVDDQYRLVDITRTGVVLGVGKTHFRLPLGGDTAKTAPRAPIVNATPSGVVSATPTTGPGFTGPNPSVPNPATPNASVADSQVPGASAPGSTVSSAAVPDTPATPAPSGTNDPTSDPFLDSAAAGKGPL